MSIKRFKSLTDRYLRIDGQIEKEQSIRRPDWLRLIRLKKLRLMIKDQIYRMARVGLYPAKQMKPALAVSRIPRKK
jgi:uncharacterized protein YdcH (DUF465 family)